MAGLATAGRLCQPTNPPPKRYKPPMMTKSQQYGNLQRYKINPKITGPCCGAGTSSYVATYSHNLTNTRKPTMTPPADRPSPTLPKSGEQYANKTASRKIMIRTAHSMTAPPTPRSANQLPVNHHPPSANHNPHDRPNGTTKCPTPYRPPKMMKNNNPTIPGCHISPTKAKPNQSHHHIYHAKLEVGFPTTDQPVSSKIPHTNVSTHTTPSQLNCNIRSLSTHDLQQTLNDINQTMNDMSQRLPEHLSNGTNPNNTNNEPLAITTSNDTPLQASSPTPPCTRPYATGNHPVSFRRIASSTDEIIRPATLPRQTNCMLSLSTAPLPFSSCENTSRLSKDQPNSIMALKEAVSSLNEKLDLLFSIIAPLPLTARHNTTETSPSAIFSNLDTLLIQEHDTIPPHNQSDNIYELMLALCPTIYDPLTHLHEPTLTTVLLTLWQNSQTTYNRGNRSAKLYYLAHYNTGTSDTLRKKRPAYPTYTKDLRKPP